MRFGGGSFSLSANDFLLCNGTQGQCVLAVRAAMNGIFTLDRAAAERRAHHPSDLWHGPIRFSQLPIVRCDQIVLALFEKWRYVGEGAQQWTSAR